MFPKRRVAGIVRTAPEAGHNGVNGHHTATVAPRDQATATALLDDLLESIIPYGEIPPRDNRNRVALVQKAKQEVLDCKQARYNASTGTPHVHQSGYGD